MTDKIAIGVDIGGTHISCAAVDLLNKRLLDQTCVSKKVDNQAQSDLILNSWAHALQECINKLQGLRFQGIGFAMPGPFDYENGIALFERVKKFE